MTVTDTENWVRPYTATDGRTLPSTELDLGSQVRATGRIAPRQLELDHAHALQWCRTPTSVAEVAGRLGHPVMVTKVLLSDLIESGALITSPATFTELSLTDLERVLDGLRRL